jgi:DNA-binding transcriptional MerR regulator
MKKTQEWIAAPEAANRLGLSISTVRRLALEGMLYRRDRGAKRYYAPSVEAYRRGIRKPNQWAKELAAP